MRTIDIDNTRRAGGYFCHALHRILHDGTKFVAVTIDDNNHYNAFTDEGHIGKLTKAKDAANRFCGYGIDGKIYLCTSPIPTNDTIFNNCAVIDNGRVEKVKNITVEKLVYPDDYNPWGAGIFSDSTDKLFVATQKYFKNAENLFEKMFGLKIGMGTLIFTNKNRYVNWTFEVPTVSQLSYPTFSRDGLTLAVYGIIATDNGNNERKIFVIDLPEDL